MVDMKKMKNKIVALWIIVFALSSLQVFAQREPSEFTIFGGGGLSFFGYQAPVEKVSSIGYHGDIGVGFTGFVSRMCGFHVGAGFGLLNVKARVGNLKNLTPGKIDDNDYPFDLHASLLGYSEVHKTLFVSVPLLFQFQTKQNQYRGSGKSFYAMSGVKLLMLFNTTCDTRVANLYNAAYYPEFDNWAATQKFAGLGTFDGITGSEKFGVALLPMFTFETGIKWNLKAGLLLYTGVYFDCALTDPTKKNRTPVSELNTTESSLSLLALYKKSSVMDLGIKLRLAFYKSNTNNSYKKKSPQKTPCNYTY